MNFILSEHSSIANHLMAQIRDRNVQKDRLLFRKNLERLGEILAYEISKTFDYQTKDVETPLGTAKVPVLKDRIVLATILRAGLPMHQGMLNLFDTADNAFVSAYRAAHKDGSFEVKMEYISCPDINDSVLILSDAMIATGASMVLALKSILSNGKPKSIHIATGIASSYGYEYIRRIFPDVYMWMGALDEELTAKSYIVPGLGDAGDLCYGVKPEE